MKKLKQTNQLLAGTKKSNKGGARVGSGRKKENVLQVTLSLPADQLTLVDEYYSNRSKAYAAAMKDYLKLKV